MARNPCRIYISGFPEDVKEREVEDIFYKYGKIRDIDIKRGMRDDGTTFAFVDFGHPLDAEDAVQACDGMRFDGRRLRVEPSGKSRGPPPSGEKHPLAGPPSRTEWRVVVLGLPESASWQDLKDHMRKAGKVGYANIVEKGRGIVEYQERRDMDWALDRLHRSEFRNPYSTSQIEEGAGCLAMPG
mmetsp:Transcript_24654/g.48363  ORF Transcript_24654/g.48363 Transcript_24654/m.48363 type:complete len:185 (+) Transcript_24654:168-722(+)